MIRKAIIIMDLLLSVTLLNSVSVYAEEKGLKDKDQKEPGWFSTQNPYKTGIIFNVSDILLDLDSYQGGIGFKRYFNDSLAYRAALDFSYSDSSSSWLVSLGNTIEYHFTDGRISPYIGGFLDLGYAYYMDEIDANNWTKVTSIPLSIGPIFGVELAVFDFLSLFAEYSVTLNYTTTITEQNVASSESIQTESSFDISTGMGNDSKIGIVIYFNRILQEQGE